MSRRIWSRFPALCMRTTRLGLASKPMTPIESEGPSSSTVARAASLASSIFSPSMEPDLSITSAMAIEASSRRRSPSRRTGRIPSMGVPCHPPRPKLCSPPAIKNAPPLRTHRAVASIAAPGTSSAAVSLRITIW